MAEATVQVEQLGKRYRIGHRRPMADGLRHVIGDALARPFRGRMKTEALWALRDATFDVSEGEVLGVIGANGAGKTTLLRILSRITPPTEGQARLRGRVGSLLEVGTGFHPELTGRENIFVNGAILGMRRREIRRHFDEIVAFSELERFLDTPVKRYSAGMYVRLAFAIAAHLQPEILLVDEVLAVGDAGFRTKCLDKMGQVARGGRTVLFVSHNMAAVNSLCQRALLLDQGRIVERGPVADVTEAYQAKMTARSVSAHRGYAVDAEVLSAQRGDGFEVTDVELLNDRSADVGPRTGDPLTVRVAYRAERDFISPSVQILCRDVYGQLVFWLSTGVSPDPIEAFHRHGEVSLHIPFLPLVAGPYSLTIERVRRGYGVDQRLNDVVRFDVQPQDVYGGGMALDRRRGLFVLDHEWTHRAIATPGEKPGADATGV